MARKRFSEREVLETLAWQGTYLYCHRCEKPFFELVRQDEMAVISVKQIREIEREHLHEYKLGGDDKPFNCRYSCKPCHAIITNGTKATSAGSSNQRIAKVRRLLNPRKSKHPMPKTGRKIPSRKFQRRAKP